MFNGFSAVFHTQPWLRIVRTLAVVGAPCCLRELVDLTDLSPGGVRDILQRLVEIRAVKVSKQGNRRLFSIILTKREMEALRILLGSLEEKLIARNNRGLSAKAGDLLNWNQQMLSIWKNGKRNAT